MYTFDSRVRYSECDCEGKLTTASLLNYFQDCSTFQSEDLGLGFRYMREVEMVWVLSYWQIVVERYPDLGEKIQIGTLPYEFKRFLGFRNFFMRTEKGEYLAKANSIWSLLDVNSGLPVLPRQEMLEGFAVEEQLSMEYAPRKVLVPQNGVYREKIVVKKQHLDTNHHVNNGQYVDLALQYLPEDVGISQLRVEYKQQAFLEDELVPYVAEGDGGITVAFMDRSDKPYAVVEAKIR